MLAGRMLPLGATLAMRPFRTRLAMGSLGSGRLRFRRYFGARLTMFAGSPRLTARATRLVASAAAAAARTTATAATSTTTAVARFQGRGLEAGNLDARDGGADQLLDSLDQGAHGRGGILRAARVGDRRRGVRYPERRSALPDVARAGVIPSFGKFGQRALLARSAKTTMTAGGESARNPRMIANAGALRSSATNVGEIFNLARASAARRWGM